MSSVHFPGSSAPALGRVLGLLVAFLIVLSPLLGTKKTVLAEPVIPTALQGQVVGHLQTDQHLITIFSGHKGIVFTIRTQDGKVMARELSIGELVASFPDLADTVSTGLAGNDARLLIMN